MSTIDVLWLQLFWLVTALVVYALTLLVQQQRNLRRDTNVYFDMDSGYTAVVAGTTRAPWRLSIIHAGLLDEALLALSAEPLVFAELAPRLKRPFTPGLSWVLPPDPTGVRSMTVVPGSDDLVKLACQAAALAVQWGYNVSVGLALRFVGWIAALVAHRLILRTLLRSVNSGGLGIPEHELRDARIDVVPIPSLRAYFDQETWDMTQALVDEPPVGLTTADRRAQWGFLWDQEQLAAQIRESQIWKRISPTVPLIQKHRGAQFEDHRWLQRVSVAVEERIREASGLVPLNHSGYYSNQKVIEKLSELLSSARDSN
jgi:hypothetical protein